MKTIPAQVDVKTERNGYQIDSHPIKIEINNTEFFQSLGIKPASVVLAESAERGKEAVLEKMAKCSREKNAKLGPDALTVAELAVQQSTNVVMSKLDFIPNAKPNISWKDGYISIEYIKDERNVEMTPARIEFEYIPYKVEFYAHIWREKYPPEDVTPR